MRLTRLLSAGALIGGLMAGPALAETLKVTTFLPPMHTFVKAITAWGDEINAKSGGALQLEVFPAAQLGPPPRQFGWWSVSCRSETDHKAASLLLARLLQLHRCHQHHSPQVHPEPVQSASRPAGTRQHRSRGLCQPAYPDEHRR